MKNTKKKGFTLVELVIVIAVIAILAAVLIPTFTSVITRANQSSRLQSIKAAVDEEYVKFVADEHQVPTYIKVESDGTVTFAKATGTNYVQLTEGKYYELNDVYKVYLKWSADGYEILTLTEAQESSYSTYLVTLPTTTT